MPHQSGMFRSAPQILGITPLVGEWIASRLLAKETAIKALMLVDDSGTVVTHKMNSEEGPSFDTQAAPLLVDMGRLVAFLRVDAKVPTKQIQMEVSDAFTVSDMGALV